MAKKWDKMGFKREEVRMRHFLVLEKLFFEIDAGWVFEEEDHTRITYVDVSTREKIRRHQ
jgi:hypothetical protein